MKRFVLSTILLLGSPFVTTWACGPYYPYGEDVRFNLLKPDLFGLEGYSLFQYSSSYYNSNHEDGVSNQAANHEAQQMNMALWQQRCKGKASMKDIREAVYELPLLQADLQHPNSFIRSLSANNDLEAIEYLNFAKRCEPFNGFLDDPWERQEVTRLPQRKLLIEEAEAAIDRLKDPELRRRYAFVAIRLAFYNANPEKIAQLYKTVFGNRPTKDILYYWSTYFYCASQPTTAHVNFLLAQVFANAPDKRFMVDQYANRKIPIQDVLRHATSPAERSAVQVLYAARNPAKGLEALQAVYRNTPRFEGLDFLLLREVNKLEDWICTPYYTEFPPSLVDGKSIWYRETEITNRALLQKRMAADKLYARKLLDFMAEVDLEKVRDPQVWQTAKAYLLFMVGDYETALQEFDSPLLRPANRNRTAFVEKIKALALTAQQAPDQAVIPELAKPLLMKYEDDKKFVFALGRELEYRNNTTNAALLYSQKTKEWEDSMPFWRTKQRHCTLYADFYWDYFFYLDAQYTPEQVDALLTSIKENQEQDAFSKWKYAQIRGDVDRLHDLLGTKYMRQDKLGKALQAFRKVNDTLWTSEVYAYHYYLNANPFYTNFYAEHQPTNADTVTYTKPELVAQLLGYLTKAEDPDNKDRDYYYFLAANAYFNMTQYGNSWMMKRYFWTSQATPTRLEDDDEYFGCRLARAYYLKAKESSKDRKFAALCLRMAGRCENYRLERTLLAKMEQKYPDNDEKIHNELFERNTYYRQLATYYPDDYEDLLGNCESFERYWRARR